MTLADGLRALAKLLDERAAALRWTAEEMEKKKEETNP